MPKDETGEIPRDRTQQLPRTFAVRQTKRVVVGVVGGSLIVIAIVIVPIPGPWSIALTLVGLTILSWEFHWAKRLLFRLKTKVKALRARRKRRS